MREVKGKLRRHAPMVAGGQAVFRANLLTEHITANQRREGRGIGVAQVNAVEAAVDFHRVVSKAGTAVEIP